MKMDQIKLEKQLGDFKRICRESGLKLTYQRQEIYRALIASDDHPSAETIYKRLSHKIPMLSLDTVYRALAVFAKYGLVQKVETEANQVRFDAREEHHHHAICRQCNEIIDFHCASIDELQLPEVVESWGKIDKKRFVAYGICGKCLNKSEFSPT